MFVIKILRIIYYWFSVGLVAILSFIFYPCRTIGRQNVPRQGGFILASNHISNIDPMLLPVVMPRQLKFIAKDSLFRNPILGFLIRTGGGIPVRRGTADRRALGEAIDSLKAGFPVLIFPQGTRGGTKIQAGVGFLAVTAGVPVLPVFIDGTDKALPKGAVIPKRTLVRVMIGKPITFPKGSDSQAVAKSVMEAIHVLNA